MARQPYKHYKKKKWRVNSKEKKNMNFVTFKQTHHQNQCLSWYRTSFYFPFVKYTHKRMSISRMVAYYFQFFFDCIVEPLSLDCAKTNVYRKPLSGIICIGCSRRGYVKESFSLRLFYVRTMRRLLSMWVFFSSCCYP